MLELTAEFVAAKQHEATLAGLDMKPDRTLDHIADDYATAMGEVTLGR